MKTGIIIKFFEDVLSSEPEKLEVLKFLIDTKEDELGVFTGHQEALVAFIDYYGFDVDTLEKQIEDRCVENGVIY